MSHFAIQLNLNCGYIAQSSPIITIMSNQVLATQIFGVNYFLFFLLFAVL